ncbi:MAG: GNAT family N-acetyltransferase [Erysipelotrichaceae bacterium]|nr:GNAT family N-acetyltransferase [Erysipelotrichaceae bacterium]MDD3924001.1 GNAT family N-acetyltransferase [Erysipelotrichaceae bacterium]MDD4642589.1 GNAT family N-acetyltransferase [Erysipelotrichaceae bacterium]
MELINARLIDIDKIMVIINDAQVFLRAQGIDQWQDGYPARNNIIDDITKRKAYVLRADNNIVAYGAIIVGQDPTYLKIDGSWLNDDPYMVIHRIAVDSNQRGRGLALMFIKEAIVLAKNKGIRNIRLDTHRDNLIMQRLLDKLGFTYCGIIYLNSGAKRMAYQKILD